MKKTRKISMIPEFLKNRKTYMLTALVFTIIGILSLSFAFFQFADDTDLTSSNTIMVETMNISDITKTFTVTYEGNNGLIKTGILNAGFSDIYKFKVTNNYNESYPIGINWDAIRSTLNNLNSNYILYSCTQANYTSATIDNVSSLCTAISPSTNNYLPKTNEMYKLTSTDEITLDANETQYYIAKIVINNTESGKSFTGAIRVKHRETHTLTLNLDGGEIACDTVADMKTGDTVVLPIPTKTGYVFEGWSIGEVDSVINHYTFTMGSMDTTLTASWTANIQNFLYSGNVQIFTVPQTGTYKVEAWGASGGKGYHDSSAVLGAYGGYTKGEIYLEKDEKLYIYVGGQGKNASSVSVGGTGGYNGGAQGGNDNGNDDAGGGGGGASDIRYFASEPTGDILNWNSELGLNSRIMVAGGGAGGFFSGIDGFAGGIMSYCGARDLCANQTYGYAFGQGGNATSEGNGGGGGFYGGFGGENAYISGSGGSSYISGHEGCNSIVSSISRIHSGSSIHYSQKYFNNTQMIDGHGYNWNDIKGSLESMPNPTGSSYALETGHSGNGYARISFINYLEIDDSNVNDEMLIKNSNKTYSYVSNQYQIFTAPQTGTYKAEAWGASGGIGYHDGAIVYGAEGAYTSGEIYLEENEKLYIYVGGQGKDASSVSVGGAGGYNGGAQGGNDSGNDDAGGGGGGATDIRFFPETPTLDDLTWNSVNGLKFRIMVAGGGAGGHYKGKNGFAGGLISYYGIDYEYAGQSFGYAFGQGENALTEGNGGGGGYYGGFGGKNANLSGSGGSSYISGHVGCNSLLNNFSLIHTGSPIHFSQKFFRDTTMIDGKGYEWSTIKNNLVQMPNPNGGYYAAGIGNSGNGVVKISFMSSNIKQQSTIDLEILNNLKNHYFSFSQSYQIFTVKIAGIYQIEAWGAPGGIGYRDAVGIAGGEGAYTSGNIYLDVGEKLYIYLGQKGKNAPTVAIGGTGGIHGGGNGGSDSGDNDAGGGGGGSTDIRYFVLPPTDEELSWTYSKSLNSRIMVAAGGGGGGYSGKFNQAGGLKGYYGGTVLQATQTGGYAFGQGGNGALQTSGGGGGYYGGAGGTTPSTNNTGSGGSSYISGHIGSVAVSAFDNTTPKNGCTTGTTNILCSEHYTSKVFDNTTTVMIDGAGYSWTHEKSEIQQMPNPWGGVYSANGHVSDGYVRITLYEQND